jgi:hypothetical protein
MSTSCTNDPSILWYNLRLRGTQGTPSAGGVTNPPTQASPLATPQPGSTTTEPDHRNQEPTETSTEEPYNNVTGGCVTLLKQAQATCATPIPTANAFGELGDDNDMHAATNAGTPTAEDDKGSPPLFPSPPLTLATALKGTIAP